MRPVWCSTEPVVSGSSESKIYSINNRVYFRDMITENSITQLCKELISMDDTLYSMVKEYSIPPIPIYLFITTDGGEFYAVARAIDCISQLSADVYTVIDGFVASAGTLLSIIGKKRFIQPSAYMLIHQIRSSIWGKMRDIEDEVDNLKKITTYIIKMYTKKTNITEEELVKILKCECIWDAEECIKHGMVDAIYQVSSVKSKKRRK